ncbi:hypothetical protein FDP41_000355 [Naegleria fowleri]|uniref:Axoneme central apparatus protein n=1 Tax=Naegleria fowleri TaxID=5763 RepID=A0A6A5C9P2_NAEFO|nr:uncharacterized protein FDP41_000355 [Naegleria fowleri]KAF0984456.1 hypothetical protein FDP41_000355 [Naegleria fowleri]CAG4718797.1 unnamed protein product [Naegleria fowleri]
MSSKEITQVFATYKKARTTFANSVAELVKQPRHIEAMIQQETGMLDLLRPLLLDTDPSVQQNAALALGRLANYSPQLAEKIVASEIVPQLVASILKNNKYYQRHAAFVLRAIAKHGPRLAQAVVDSGAVDALVKCLDEFDPLVKESAAYAIGNISMHSPELAQICVDQGCVGLLLTCAQQPEQSLKKVAISSLANICSHTPELAQAVVDAEGIPVITPLILNPVVKRQACQCLAFIAKHSVELAELVVEGEIFPKIFALLQDPEDEIVRKNAASCIMQVSKHNPELAALIVNAGGLPAIVDYVSNAEGDNKLPGIMILGFIAAFQETMATAVIKAKSVQPLGNALSPSYSDHLRAAAAWSLGQIGRHSSEHAKAVAEANILTLLNEAFLDDKASEDLKSKSKRALKAIIQKCTYLDALNPLLSEKAPQSILKYVVKQFEALLPDDVEAKKRFVQSKGLQKLQLIKTDDEALQESIKFINNLYPDELVKYYTPGYDKELLQKIDE